MALDASALSDRQFRRKVFEELQNAGTIDGLKGTLRSRLVGVLQRRDPGVFQGSGPGPGQQSLWQRAANSLYVEYLQHQNYGYALSVFQPECGLTNQQVMTRDELARVLGLGPTSSVVQYMPKPDEHGAEPPLLLGILQALADAGGSGARREITTQTEDHGGNSSLALRLAQIDEMHERAVESERVAPLRDAEERMASFQRECEDRMRHEMEEQVRRVRDHEVGQARLEEAAKHRRQLAEAREELERVHAERLRKLRAREESQLERVRAAESALERAAYDHRQRLASEHEKLREAKEEAHREETERAVNRAREEEDLKRRDADIKSKEGSWSMRYAELSAEAEERALSRRRETETEAERRLEMIKTEMMALEDERAKLELDRAQHAVEIATIAQARRDAMELKKKHGQQATATEILAQQLDDLNAQLDVARRALAKRGIALPVPKNLGGGIKMGLTYGDSLSYTEEDSAAYAQVVAAMERAKSEADLARRELADIRGDFNKLKKERVTLVHDKHAAVRMAEDLKVKYELANKRAEDAVKTAQEAWVTINEQKPAWKKLLDDEKDRRVAAEAACGAYRTAMMAPGASAADLGLESMHALLPERLQNLPEPGDETAASTVTKLRLQKLEMQQEKQRQAIADHERQMMFEKQRQQYKEAMAKTEIEAKKMEEEAALEAKFARAKLEAQEKHKAELKAQTPTEIETEYSDDDFEIDEEKFIPSDPIAQGLRWGIGGLTEKEKEELKNAPPLQIEEKVEEEPKAAEEPKAVAEAEPSPAPKSPAAAPESPAKSPAKSPAASPRQSRGSSQGKKSSPGVSGSAEIEEFIEEEEEFVPDELDEVPDELDVSIPYDSGSKSQNNSSDSVF